MKEKRILVVDDEEQIRDVYSQAFSRAGYTVQAAESAEEALDIMEDEQFPVMFLDLNLPGMNGVDLCRKVRKDSPKSVLYAVTGYGSLFHSIECKEAGFEDYLTKPVSLSKLVEAAEDAFEKAERALRTLENLEDRQKIEGK